MAYIGNPFVHDLVISYSHGDVDGAGTSPLKRWSQGFIRELMSELRMHPKFGKDLSVFFDDNKRPDQGLDPMSGLTEQLRGDIGGAAILLVLMSEHYLNSRWCADERAWWLAKQAELGLARDERLAVARIWETAAQWPRELSDERGNPFVGVSFIDKARGGPWPYEWPEPTTTSGGVFRTALLDIVGWLWRRVEVIKNQIDERSRALQDAARLSENTGQVLYLHGRIEQTSVWEKTNAALSDEGFTVLPGEPDPVVRDPEAAQKIRRQRVETLGGCDALLLLGTQDTRALDADLVVVGRQDRHSARALSNRFLPCGLLNTIGLQVATEQRKRATRGLQVDWIDSTHEPWVIDVRRWLTAKSVVAGGAQ